MYCYKLIQYLAGISTDLSNFVKVDWRNYNIFDMCSWLVWKDLWLKDKKGSPKIRDRYNRRKLVLVELEATNIESEVSYEHPAVRYEIGKNINEKSS